MKDNELLFYLTSSKYIYYSFYADDGRTSGTARLSIDPKLLESVPKGTENALMYLSGAGLLPKPVKNKMGRLVLVIDKHVSSCKNGLLPILKLDIDNLIAFEVGKKVRQKSGGKLYDQLKYRIEGMKSGEILHDGLRYAAPTILYHSGTLAYVEKSGIGKKDISKITMSDIEVFRKSILAAGDSHNTLSLYNNTLISFFSLTYGTLHKNPLHLGRGVRIGRETLDYPVFLSEAEILQLSNTTLSKKMYEVYRDIFIYGCFTCLRYSDYTLQEENNVVDGYLVVNSQKTTETAYIPLHPIVRKLIDKYEGRLPKRKIEYMNSHIKTICKEAQINERVLFVRTEGGKVRKEYMQKWELVTTHTMRRSFATNAWLSGVPLEYIMELGGWKTLASLKKYLRMSKLDIAKKAGLMPFFNPT